MNRSGNSVPTSLRQFHKSRVTARNERLRTMRNHKADEAKTSQNGKQMVK